VIQESGLRIYHSGFSIQEENEKKHLAYHGLAIGYRV
jgi:hypothetical protein